MSVFVAVVTKDTQPLVFTKDTQLLVFTKDTQLLVYTKDSSTFGVHYKCSLKILSTFGFH
jgi:hypothetical protein